MRSDATEVVMVFGAARVSVAGLGRGRISGISGRRGGRADRGERPDGQFQPEWPGREFVIGPVSPGSRIRDHDGEHVI